MTYVATGFFKLAEEQDYENGMVNDTEVVSNGHLDFSAPTLPRLFDRLRDFFFICDDGEGDDLLLDVGGQAGHLEVERLELADGSYAMPEDIAKWKRGDLRLWRALYSFTVTRATVVRLKGVR